MHSTGLEKDNKAYQESIELAREKTKVAMNH